ncbi:MAG: hypothetical protein OXB84_00760, partial [Halobacteriovoraceae bacterium]|nr:hypothetical protein [Halobacteriovoraceae bacterium]
MRIPQIIHSTWRKDNENWRICFYDYQQNLFLKNSELDSDVKKELAHYLVESLGDFRLYLYIKTIPFLVGIFNSKKQISFHSPRLMQELFLLEFISENQQSRELRQYTDEINSLDNQQAPSMHQLMTTKYQLPDLLDDCKYSVDTGDLETLLIKKLNRYRAGFFESCTDYGLKLTASFALLRIHLLKFIAILSSLDFDKKGVEVKRIFVESLKRLLNDSQKAARAKCAGEKRSLPFHLFFAFYLLKIVSHLLPAFILARLVRSIIKKTAKRFISGENMEQAKASLVKLHQSNRDITLDPLGELVVSRQEADNYCQEVL